ncbi:hypothetical protein C6A85_000000111850 [Mycobacterium sp. ITM-2017-0098]|nr:hypothetical protein C6A85_000000111850 [Mycobacterium sp. ITM-2017-0098]
MPAEWQWRTLDEASQQTATEVVVKNFQLVDINSPFIDPPNLHDFFLPSGPMPLVERLVQQRETIVRLRNLVRSATTQE